MCVFFPTILIIKNFHAFCFQKFHAFFVEITIKHLNPIGVLSQRFPSVKVVEGAVKREGE